MGKSASPYCLYKEQEIIDDREHIIFECTRCHCYRSALMPTVGTIMVANIVEIMISNIEKWTSVVKNVEFILRLKKRDLEPTEQLGTSAYMALAHMPNETRT